jgi:CheY-like chemotaxis protein
MKNVHCIMLIDDNTDDNYFHERTIRKSGLQSIIIVMESAEAALEYLKAKHEHPDAHPDLIFLDINMPGMDG